MIIFSAILTEFATISSFTLEIATFSALDILSIACCSAEQQAIDKISRAEKVAISKVNEEIVANSVNIAEKIIIENINEQSSKKLVEQSISQINKLKT